VPENGVCYVKHTKKNPETDGYERDISLRSEKKTEKERNNIRLTETRKKTKR